MTPAGTVETGAQRVALRVTGAVGGAKAVADTPVESGGSSFRLGDIATVTRGFEDPPSYLVRQRGKPALGIGIVMAKGANILELGEDIDAAVMQIESTLPQGFDLEKIADQPHVVDHAVHEFTKSFAEALGIVLLVSFLSLGWRTGIVVALSVPLVLAITFIVMSAIGLDLQRITLGALIIALGLLVDDAIIAVEMMVVKMEQGWDRERAASFAWTSTAFPMLTGTLVTAAGFLPVGFANSAVGEYAGGIFWVVAIALVASWVVAVLFTPYLGVKLLPDFTRIAATHRDPHEIYETRFYNALRGVIDWCVRHRVIVVLATIAVFRRRRCRLRPRAAAILSAFGTAGTVFPDAPAGGHFDRRDGGDRAQGLKEMVRGGQGRHQPYTNPTSAKARRALARPQPPTVKNALRRDCDRCA